jgi:hypothetical protein
MKFKIVFSAMNTTTCNYGTVVTEFEKSHLPSHNQRQWSQLTIHT